MSLAHQIVDVLLESPQFKTLKKARRSLDEPERQQAVKAGCTWNFTDKPTCAIWKAVVNGKTWYCSHTHRCFAADKTLKAAINSYHKTVEPSS